VTTADRSHLDASMCLDQNLGKGADCRQTKWQIADELPLRGGVGLVSIPRVSAFTRSAVLANTSGCA